jgi:hypothetical protein
LSGVVATVFPCGVLGQREPRGDGFRNWCAWLCRGKAGSWGTSLALDASEGDDRAARAVADIAREFEPRVEELALSYHNKMMELLVILEDFAVECVRGAGGGVCGGGGEG